MLYPMSSTIKIAFFVCIVFFFGFKISNAQKIQTEGVASYYADKFVGRTTANGEIYEHTKLTAAHKKLPFGTKVKVTNLSNKKTIIVVINDRGPFVKDRIIDLSKSGAKKLDFINQGITKVKIEILK